MERFQLVPHLLLNTLWQLQAYHRMFTKRNFCLEVLIFETNALQNHSQLTKNICINIGSHENTKGCHNSLLEIIWTKIVSAHS